jgi:chromosomal replication initiator protein
MDSSIWDQVLGRIETKVNRHSFYTWFRPTSFVADGGGAITVRVPNQLFKDWLTKHYSLILSEALAEVRRPGTSVLFVAEGTSVALQRRLRARKPLNWNLLLPPALRQRLRAV